MSFSANFSGHTNDQGKFEEAFQLFKDFAAGLDREGLQLQGSFSGTDPNGDSRAADLFMQPETTEDYDEAVDNETESSGVDVYNEEGPNTP